MKTLTAERSCVVVKLSDVGQSNVPLLEQVKGLVGAAPYLVLDVDGIPFTSMMLGEIVNLYTEFQRHWGSKPHGIALAHAPEVTRHAFRTAMLSDKIPLFDDLEQAWRSFGSSPRAQARA